MRLITASEVANASGVDTDKVRLVLITLAKMGVIIPKVICDFGEPIDTAKALIAFEVKE